MASTTATDKKKKGARNKFADFFKLKPVHITMKVLGAISKCVMTVFLIGVITVTVVGFSLVMYVMTSFDAAENLPDLNNLQLGATSMVLTGNEDDGYVETPIKGAKREWVSYTDIPLNMINAVTAIEDKRFWEHNGVDWKRTIAAAINMVVPVDNNTFGGSTITQQLIKNLKQDDDVSVSRKVREIFRALEMEKNVASKQTILETYLNILPLSSNVVGVGAAAKYYFGKEVQDLTLAECALIAGITQNPSRFDPYSRPDNAKQRQRTVLGEMFDRGDITEDEYINAYNQELHYGSMYNYDVNDYYDDLIIENAIDILSGEPFDNTREMAESMVYYGGIKIYSCKDAEIQKKIQDLMAVDSTYPKRISDDKVPPSGGVIILDYTGKVVATASGPGEKEADRVLNYATRSKRQPGSAMKPLAVYTPAIQLNIHHFSSMILDKSFAYRQYSKWPKNDSGNYGSGNYYPLADMLAKSYNTAAARILYYDLSQEGPPERSYQFLTENFHLTTLVESDKVPALALGGLTEGVKAIEMAAAYQVFGNGGYYNTPYTFTKITQVNAETGEEVTLFDRDTEDLFFQGMERDQQVIDTDTAYIMNRIMQKTAEPGGTAYDYVPNILGNQIFAKTGTTSDDKDVYFMGGTSRYVAAVWYGYAEVQRPLNNKDPYRQKRGARMIFKTTMEALHQGLEVETFEHLRARSGTVDKRYCKVSGDLAVAGCSSTAMGVYKVNNTPGNCTVHASHTD